MRNGGIQSTGHTNNNMDIGQTRYNNGSSKQKVKKATDYIGEMLRTGNLDIAPGLNQMKPEGNQSAAYRS